MGEYSYLYNEDNYDKNCITGDTDHLYEYLKKAIAKAVSIDVIVAFLMESGVKLIMDDLGNAVARGAVLRILCGNYLNITQPQALYLIRDLLGDKVDLRFYNNPDKSFHPKAYIFSYREGGEVFIGSSNISRSALTNGIEWNYRLRSDSSPQDYAYFKQRFNDLFFNHSIIVDDDEMRRYAKSWKKPKLFFDIEKLEDAGSEKVKAVRNTMTAETRLEYITKTSSKGAIIDYPRPMGAQIEALYELKKARLDGWDRGVVVAATGVGKTFLAAFDSKQFQKILFVAHRKEILLQAERTFKCVKPEASTGFFSGKHKEKDCDILFATVQTIGRKEYLDGQTFARDEFDYIIIDEFHHAVAKNYTNIIEYFKPRFLLGLTATPERLDNQDVFALCDYNLIYEARLKEAINRGWLVPFRYYGIYDNIDYSGIEYKNGKYDERQLEQALSINKRADLILHNYLKYNSERALGFCSSRKHAIYMAQYFKDHGINACAVVSGNSYNDDSVAPYVVDRSEAVKKLKIGDIKVIFSVDMFNEGLDIPELDMVMFLRPTESPAVFLQQLGRGLRRTVDKKYVNVLDFIGNYKKANLIPFFLTGDIQHRGSTSKSAYIPDEDEYPEGCFVDFDFRLIDIFKRMADEQKNLFCKIKEEYFRVKEYIGERPLRLAMYTYIDEGMYRAMQGKKNMNIFMDYIAFLDKIGEILPDEQALIGTEAHKFLVKIENTGMTKTYKMPILLAFYNDGNIKLAIDEDDIYESFKDFYSRPSNAVDLTRDAGTSNYKEWGKKEYVALAKKNPIKFLKQSASEFFREENGKFCLSPVLAKYIRNPAFAMHFKDIIDYRTRRFYKERLEKLL